ncbi:AbrB family transcriptional regulator [Brevibacillus laterosporus]|nr:AbrB family transcriptional regulator [Brevibacillus laterosporus]TPG74357.1 AbrB family transcriptional regulator [Brevibacillus laterosporus]
MIERKVTRIGNSVGVSMTDLLKKIGAEIGDTVSLEVNDKNEIVIKKSNKVELPEDIDPQFFEAIQYTIDNYDETLKGLKDR